MQTAEHTCCSGLREALRLHLLSPKARAELYSAHIDGIPQLSPGPQTLPERLVFTFYPNGLF